MKFNEDYRRHLINRLMMDDRVIKAFGSKLKPEYFDESADQQKIVAEVRAVFSKSGERPSPDYIVQKLSGLKKPIYESCFKEMEAIMGTELRLTEREFDELTREFILHHALIDTLTSAITHVEEGEYNAIQTEIAKTFDLHGAGVDLGLSPFDIDRWKHLHEEEGQRIPTPWPGVNRLTYGGIALKEMAFVLSREGGYKSYTLANIAKGAIAARVPTVVYTLEMDEVMWCARLISMMTGVKVRELVDDPDQVRVRLKRIQNMLRTQITVKQFPTKMRTVSDLRSHLVSWEIETKCKPGLVIVDSADLLVPEGKHNEHRHGLAQIWTALRGWAVENKFAIWTAKHTNRYSGWQEQVDEDAVAEDKTCMRIADFAMAVQQTREEYQAGMLRFGVLKWRNDKGGQEFPVEINERTVAMKEFSK